MIHFFRSILFLVISLFVVADAHAQYAEKVLFDAQNSSGKISGFAKSVETQSPMTSIQNIEGNAFVVKDTGRSTNRIDVVFLGDGFTSGEQTNYATRVNEYASDMFLQEPFLEYQEYFNIHRVELKSVDSGVDHEPTYGILKNTTLDSQYWCQGVESTLCTDVAKSWTYAALARDFDQIVVLVNSERTGTAAYPFSDLSVVAAHQNKRVENLLHVFGHSFGNLADEYDTGFWPTYTGFEPGEPNVSAQNAVAMTFQNLKWVKWLGAQAFGSTIDTYEGAMGNRYGIYRPTLTSKMRELDQPFNAPSIEALIKEMYRYVKPIDDATSPSIDGQGSYTGQNTFFVKPLKTKSDTVKVQWYIDGSAIPGATGTTFRPNNFQLANGTKTITAKVVDTTPWMRDENFRAKSMSEQRSWQVVIDQRLPVIVEHPKSTSKFPGQTADFSVVAQGEEITYQWYKNGNKVSGATGSSISVVPVQRANDKDEYYVVVSNVAGSVRSNSAILTVGNRAPTYSGQTAIETFRGVSVGFAFTLSDLDNDALTVRAELDSVGTASGAKVIVSQSQLDLTVGASYLGSYYVNLIISDGKADITVPILVTVRNRAPQLEQVPNQTISWNQDFINVDLNGSDPDPMDVLVYSAALGIGEIASVQVSVQGNKIKIDPASGYVGQFVISAKVSDGLLYTTRDFVVTWSNSAPSIAPISAQRMFYKNDSLSVPISASDANNDTLTMSAKVVSGFSGLQLSFNGNNLVINPPALSQAFSQIEVSASDSKLSVSQRFTFESYNTPPVIAPIANQKVSPQKNSIIVPVSISDPDGDETTFEARLGSSTNEPVTLKVSGNNIEVSTPAAFTKDFVVKIFASDGDKSAEGSFMVYLNNTAPVFGSMENQFMHPKLEDERSIQISASDPDGDKITYKAYHTIQKNAALAAISISGSTLTVNPTDNYLGAIPVTIEASDGTSTAITIVTFTTYNNAPEITAVCNRAFSIYDFPVTVPFTAKDKDSESLTYEVIVEPSTAAVDLDAKYNFAPVDGYLGYNVFGYKEKFLKATVSGQPNTLVFISADNKLYKAGESFERSTYLEDVLSVFYENPLLLVDATVSEPSISATVKNSEVHITPLRSDQDLAVVRLRAKDSFTFDEESFIVATGTDGSGFDIDSMSDIMLHWTQDKIDVQIPIKGKVNPSNISVKFFYDAKAVEFDRLYQFAYLMSDVPNPIGESQRPAYNKDGLQEKYFIGLDTFENTQNSPGLTGGHPIVYSIVPDGTIRRYQVEHYSSNDMYRLDKAVVIGKVSPLFYKHPSLLLEPPGAAEPNVRLKLAGSQLTIEATEHYLGRSILEVSSGKKYAGTQLVLFDRYNTIPVHSEIPGVNISYRTKPFTFPVSASDEDQEDKNSIVKKYTVEPYVYNRFDKYDLKPDVPFAKRYNQDGWRELRLTGVYNGRESQFAILPSGAVYADWNGSPHTSAYVTHAANSSYRNPSTIDGRNWAGDYLENNPLKDIKLELQGDRVLVTLPEDLKVATSYINFVGRAYDGLSMGESSVRITVKNTNPIFYYDQPLSMHWREGAKVVPLHVSDEDGLDDIDPDSVFVGQAANNGSPGRLAANASLSSLSVNLGLGAPRVFDFKYGIKDRGGAGVNLSAVLQVYNNVPTLKDIGTVNFNHTSTDNKINLEISDSDSLDHNKFKAFVMSGGILTNVGNTIAKYKLQNNSNIPHNTAGSYELHLTGMLNGKAQEFILLKNGALYAWNGTFDPDLLVAFLPENAWYNFNFYLFASPVTESLTRATVTGNSVAFERNGTPLAAPQNFTVIVSDGIDFVTKPITVVWKDNPPVLPADTSIKGHWRNGALSLAGFPDKDVDGDVITYTMTATPNVGYTQQIANGELKVNPRPNSIATHSVVVNAKSTSFNVSGNYVFQFTNDAPIFQDSGVFTVGYKETVSIAPKVIDPNQDPLTMLVSLIGENASGYKATIVSNTIKIEPVNPKPGKVIVRVVASDTIASVTNDYEVNFVNRPPVFTKVPNISMKWSEKTKSGAIEVSDPDNDPITFTTSVDSSIATAQVQNGNLLVNLLKYTPSFDVKITASDGLNKVNATAIVSVSNRAPVMGGLPSSKSVHWRTESFSVPLNAADADGDALTYDAKLLDPAFPATVQVSNGSLVVSLPEKKLGRFNVEVGASDGVVRISSKMLVEVTNTAPKISELSNIFVSGNSGSYSIETSASDPDNDPITLSAKLVTAEQVAYELNVVHNFHIGSPNFNFNRLGNAEKYLKGRRANDTKDNDYVIYPNGRMYIWTGVLSTSTYLGTVPFELYQDPAKFVGAVSSNTSVNGVTVSVSGNAVVLDYVADYSGTVWVNAAVSDTKETVGIFFSVTKDDAADPSDPNQCNITKDVFDGDYQFSGSPLFVAHAKLGDSLSPGLSSAYEMSLGKNSNGVFNAGETSNYGWQSNKKVSFSITYDPDSKLANFIIDGSSVRHTVADNFSASDILIRINRSYVGSSVTINDLLINGKLIDSSINVSDATNMVKTLKIRAVNELNKKFTIQGSVTISYGSMSLKDTDLDLKITLMKSHDAPLSCIPGDGDGNDGGEDGGEVGTGKKVTICHIPGGDFSRAKTISIGKSALPAHLAHGDVIGACPGQGQDPGDPSTGGPTCEQKQVITSPNYTFWNSFLQMVNILELVNGTNKDIVVKVSFYSISGTLFDQRSINVRANNQFDLIVNDLNNFVKDSYGIIKLEFEGNLDGRMSFYRPSADKSGYDYAFTVPLIDATFGTTSVSFNTYQPSFKPEEANNQVANWLSIVNLDSELRTFTVLTYDTPGRLIMRREVDVPSFGRMDIDGGHGIVGPNVVGYHKIIPKNVTGEYITQLIRYGGNSPAGFAPSQFKFAVPLSSKLGQSDPQYMPISNKFGETNWIEVINVLDKPVGASINYYASSGQLLESVDAYIAANAQMHFEASKRLPANDVGYAVVVPFEPFSIVAQSMGYLREKSAGSVTAVYGTQSRRIVPCMQAGSYNLYLNMQNYVLVANPTNESVEATVAFSTPTSMAEKRIILTPKSAMQIPVHNNAELKTKPDTYGLISVYPKDPSVRLFSEVLRLRYRTNGNPDFAMSVPIR